MPDDTPFARALNHLPKTLAVALGSGRRLFDGGPAVSSAFVLESVTTRSKGIIVSDYRPDGAPRTARSARRLRI